MMKKPKEINIDSMLFAISKIIKEQKEYLGMTVAELSEKSEVSVGVISDLINNRGRVPSLANFVKLAAALQLPEDMFTGLIMGKIDAVQKENKCTREKVERTLLQYGLSKSNMQSIMIQIDALIESQCSAAYHREASSK